MTKGAWVRTLAAALAAAAGCAADPDHGSVVPDAGSPVDANNPVPPPAGVVAAGVRWVGRVDTTNAAQPRFGWSGTGFAAQFSGQG